MAAKVRAWLPRLRGLWESIKIQGLRHQNGNHSPGVLIKPIGYNHQQLAALRPAFRAPVFNIFTAEKSRLQLLQKLFPFKPLTSLPVPVRAVNHHCRFYYQRSSLIVNPCLVRNFARGNRAALGFGRNFSSFPQASAKGGGVLAQLGVKPFTTTINMNGVSWRKTNEIEEKANLSETKVQRRKPKTGKKKTSSQSLLSVAPGTKANKVDNDSSSTSLQKNTASPAHQGIPSLQKSIVNQLPAHQGNDDDVYMSGGKLITSRVKQLDPSIIQSIHEVATTEQNHSMAIISILRILLQHKAFDIQVLDFEIRIFFGMGVEDVTRLLNCLGIDQKSLNFTLKSETTNPSTKLAVVVIFEPTNSQLSTLIKVGDHEPEPTKSAPINLNEYIVDHKLSHLSTIIEASDHEPEPTPPLPRPLTLPFALFPKKNNGTDSRPYSASRSSPIHGEGDIDDFLSQVDSRPSLNVKPRDGQSEIRYKKW